MNKISYYNLKSMIYGIAIGDAFGVPYEFRNKKCVEYMIEDEGRNLPKGTWSDDTSMTLALLCSLISKNKVDRFDISQQYYGWIWDEKYTCGFTGVFDVGNTIEKALEWGDGVTNEELQGNGSIMCTAPMVLYPDKEDVENVCSILYNNKVSKNMCNEYIKILLEIISKKDKEIIWGNYKYKEHPIQSSGWVKDTLTCALHCFVTTNSFKEAIMKCVDYGGDTDTCASVCGAMCGLYYGYDNIPKEWINDLLSKDIINGILGMYKNKLLYLEDKKANDNKDIQ